MQLIEYIIRARLNLCGYSHVDFDSVESVAKQLKATDMTVKVHAPQMAIFTRAGASLTCIGISVKNGRVTLACLCYRLIMTM